LGDGLLGAEILARRPRRHEGILPQLREGILPHPARAPALAAPTPRLLPGEAPSRRLVDTQNNLLRPPLPSASDVMEYRWILAALALAFFLAGVVQRLTDWDVLADDTEAQQNDAPGRTKYAHQYTC
jgi:hypothetical protein